ncbi:MAG: isoquinoline 1-oxidoreductase [Frankiales bacterium]|nr:isoquinoline 1-oxidoreductase [Frankiales bacterium]
MSDVQDYDEPADAASSGPSRRRFLTYLMAAPTLAVAVQYGVLEGTAQAVVPTQPQPADNFDLGDFLILAGKPTEDKLIIIEVDKAGKVHCALPREEVGQGITTAVAMLIAEEMDLPLADVTVTLAPARPELMYNQLTGGSNTIRSVYTPTRTAAAAAKARLLAAGAQRTGVSVRRLQLRGGTVVGGGHSIPIGELTEAAASPQLAGVTVAVKDPSTFTLVGRPQNRKDARAMVTGQMKYTNDMEPVAGALRAMVRRPPTINGTVKSILNEATIRKMPGIRNLVVIPTGVAVLADTFGQALDGKEALEVSWNAGTVDSENNASILSKLKAVNAPLGPALGTVVEGEFDFAFVNHAPLETITAIADIKAASGTVWAGLKTPIVAAQSIEDDLGFARGSITAHVTQGGGSFGRRLFFDGALEAARISKAVGKPVKLMWTRVDDMRHGRARAASHHLVRATIAGNDVVRFEHHVASVETDFRHGLGEIMTANGAAFGDPSLIPISAGGAATFSQSVFGSTIKSPYNFGPTTQILNEANLVMHTGSFRSVYSANTRGAEEIIVDEVAKALGKDPVAFRIEYAKDPRYAAVIKKCGELGAWGTKLPAGFAQGFGFHAEYKSCTACLVEIDARDPKKPRVTKAAIVGDYGLPINPRGLESQLLGGLTDAISTTLRAGLHIDKGLALEGSYSQFHYARQKNAPREVKIHIMPPTTGDPGGAGELGLPAAVGAVANAYARATGIKPRSFPIIFPIDFTPFTKNTGSTRVQPR